MISQRDLQGSEVLRPQMDRTCLLHGSAMPSLFLTACKTFAKSGSAFCSPLHFAESVFSLTLIYHFSQVWRYLCTAFWKAACWLCLSQLSSAPQHSFAKLQRGMVVGSLLPGVAQGDVRLSNAGSVPSTCLPRPCHRHVLVDSSPPCR